MGYYRKSIRNYGKVALHSRKSVQWDMTAEEAFKPMKEIISHEVTLKLPNINRVHSHLQMKQLELFWTNTRIYGLYVTESTCGLYV